MSFSLVEEHSGEKPTEEFQIHRRKKQKRSNQPIIVHRTTWAHWSVPFDQDNMLSAVGPTRHLQMHGLSLVVELLDLGQKWTLNTHLWHCWYKITWNAAMLIDLEKMTPMFIILTNKNDSCNSCICLSNLALVFGGGVACWCER